MPRRAEFTAQMAPRAQKKQASVRIMATASSSTAAALSSRKSWAMGRANRSITRLETRESPTMMTRPFFRASKMRPYSWAPKFCPANTEKEKAMLEKVRVASCSTLLPMV